MKLAPKTRVRLALTHFWVSLGAGILCTWRLPPEGPDQMYQRVLIGISFYAITITAWDVWQTSDVRVEQENEDGVDSSHE